MQKYFTTNFGEIMSLPKIIAIQKFGQNRPLKLKPLHASNTPRKLMSSSEEHLLEELENFRRQSLLRKISTFRWRIWD